MVALTIPYGPVSVVRNLVVVAPRSRRAPTSSFALVHEPTPKAWGCHHSWQATTSP